MIGKERDGKSGGPVKKCVQVERPLEVRPELSSDALRVRFECCVIDGDTRKSQSCHFKIYVPLPITTLTMGSPEFYYTTGYFVFTASWWLAGC